MAEIRHSIQTAAKRETIYTLVATARGFAKWWATDVTESPGVVELGFFNRATVYRLRLESGTPPTQVEWVCETGDEWKGTRIVFSLEEGRPGTLIRFTHAGWATESDYFVSCNTTWGELMFRLKAVAEGKSARPLFRVADMAY
jgi:uncharacterized protein YndB with AHSA1/START domain